MSSATLQLFKANLTAALKEALTPGSEFWDSGKTLKVFSEEEYFKSKDDDLQMPDVIKAMLSESWYLLNSFLFSFVNRIHFIFNIPSPLFFSFLWIVYILFLMFENVSNLKHAFIIIFSCLNLCTFLEYFFFLCEETRRVLYWVAFCTCSC